MTPRQGNRSPYSYRCLQTNAHLVIERYLAICSLICKTRIRTHIAISLRPSCNVGVVYANTGIPLPQLLGAMQGARISLLGAFQSAQKFGGKGVEIQVIHLLF